MKTCRKCGTCKPLEDFYRRPDMVGGRLNHCKACVRARMKALRDENAEEHRRRDRQRYYMQSKRREQARRAYANTPAEKKREYKKRWAEANQEARSAHFAVSNAVRDGRISKPSRCERCDTATCSRDLHAHHEDYSRPLDVEWICRTCHGLEHRKGHSGQALGAVS